MEVAAILRACSHVFRMEPTQRLDECPLWVKSSRPERLTITAAFLRIADIGR